MENQNERKSSRGGFRPGAGAKRKEQVQPQARPMTSAEVYDLIQKETLVLKPGQSKSARTDSLWKMYATLKEKEDAAVAAAAEKVTLETVAALQAKVKELEEALELQKMMTQSASTSSSEPPEDVSQLKYQIDSLQSGIAALRIQKDVAVTERDTAVKQRDTAVKERDAAQENIKWLAAKVQTLIEEFWSSEWWSKKLDGPQRTEINRRACRRTIRLKEIQTPEEITHTIEGCQDDLEAIPDPHIWALAKAQIQREEEKKAAHEEFVKAHPSVNTQKRP